jgi:hypothetical protein
VTGYRSKFFRHKCCDQGCYVEQLPSWDDLIEVFPRGIRPTDIDGMVEINGSFLFLEEKCAGTNLNPGQRLAMRVLSQFPGITVVFFRPVALQPDSLEVISYPDPQGWQTYTRDEFKQWIRSWVDKAEGSAAA